MNLSLAKQIAQMVVVRASGCLFDHQIRYPAWEPPAAQLRSWLEDLGVGGVIFVDGSATELAVRIQHLQSWAKVPLLLAADIEEGVGQRFAGATWFPPPMAIAQLAQQSLETATQSAQQMGTNTAQEAIAIGLNWILAPVVDVNNNPDNPVINVRAFGEDPEIVSHLTAAFIHGCQQYPVLTTAKHFPGHGDTATDSHLSLPVIPHSEERLQTVELPPFKTAIAAGVDGVMSAHLQIMAWDAERPATLSPEILTQLLRRNLGFEGLIVTDALVMGAIANQYDPDVAAVLAVEAGADILLMPQDPEVTIRAVYDAVVTGRIPAERIQASVERIITAKSKVNPGWNLDGPNPHATHSASSIFDLTQTLAQPKAQKLTLQILTGSMRSGGSVPISAKDPATTEGRNLIIVDDCLNCRFLDQQTSAIAIPQQNGYKLQLLDSRCQVAMIPDNQPTILQIFIRGNPFRGSAGLTQVATTCFKNLLKNTQLKALVIYGSVYTLEKFFPTLPPGLPYVFTYGQIPEAQTIAMKVLFES